MADIESGRTAERPDYLIFVIMLPGKKEPPRH